MNCAEIESDVAELVRLASALPAGGLGNHLRIYAGLIMVVTLESINTRQNEDPLPALHKAVRSAANVIESAIPIVSELDLRHTDTLAEQSSVDTIDLFENAWTLYSDETYDHSVTLVEERLRRSGFDSAWFAGKSCFDGGCGTGRLSLAMAKLGASKVTAVDLGGESLAYFRSVVDRYGLRNIDIVEADVTDLAQWADGSFDFVASNGVLHHTPACERGILEHFRITRPGGVFWVYLYGDGGIYWRLYDLLKPMVSNIAPAVIRHTLTTLGVREGLIYTYLDNLLAPRVYYFLDDFLALLEKQDSFTWRHAKGRSEIDDTERLLATQFGRLIYGDQGEIRVVVEKSS